MDHSLIVVVRLFQILLPLTDRTFCEEVVRLKGVSQSPLVVALVVVPQMALCLKNWHSGGVASPFRILYTQQANLEVVKLSKLNRLWCTRMPVMIGGRFSIKNFKGFFNRAIQWV